MIEDAQPTLQELWALSQLWSTHARLRTIPLHKPAGNAFHDWANHLPCYDPVATTAKRHFHW